MDKDGDARTCGSTLIHSCHEAGDGSDAGVAEPHCDMTDSTAETLAAKESLKAIDTTLNHSGANPSHEAPDIGDGALFAIPTGALPQLPTGIKDETWRTLELWRFLADKKEECKDCGL